ncbi:DUF2921 family protein [Melia azedarach]|uniref:DUF2921 family protein n=1 Tax=Melia azedarach TaxID=155640 RepID=A0ACC1XAP5_MELAZ|nr:DUF2921 family protein [Melia azedarach]
MRTFPFLLHLGTLWMLWLLVFFGFATSFRDVENWDDPSVVYTYNRFTEIQHKCGPVLSSASELETDDNRGSRIKEELSFVNGDWDQESGGAPLMPFDDRDKQRTSARPGSFSKLTSFWVVDVDPVRRAKDIVSVSGSMEIGITGHQPFNYRPGWSPRFRMDPGFSSMTIPFEGVYIESEENGGERLFCLLGTSMMPTTNQFVPSMEIADTYGYKFENQPPLVQDDQIMLVLRYSKAFSLTTGNISGEMVSLRERSDFKYFDKVHISSHLGRHSKYQFGAEELLSKACSPCTYQDSLVDEDMVLFKDDKFCDTLQPFLLNGMLDILPSWKSVGSNDDANKLGPFVLSKKGKTLDEGSNNFRLIFQNVHCDPVIDESNKNAARVFAFLRVIHPWQAGYKSLDRTGVSGMTLSAEGMWRSSEGQLCMVGCLGIVGTTSDRCNSRIRLYFPLTFSINQRGMVYGTITGFNGTESNSLWFGNTRHPDLFTLGEYQRKMNLEWSYKYSKVAQAKSIRKRNELSFLVYAVPHNFSNAQKQRIHVDLEILSLGSLFGRYRPWTRNYPVVEQSTDINAEMIEISGHLSITGENFNNVSLAFEGIYDSTVGKMFLVGCRDVRIIQKNINKEMHLEGGMDCLFEVEIEYPSRNARWLKNPEIGISIISKRRREDSLHTNPISLKTAPITYDEQFQDEIFRRTFEEILRVLMLIMAIVCTRSQLHYLNSVVDHIAYISSVMIYIPVVDYLSPLINGGEIFFKWKVSHSQIYLLDPFMAYERFRILDYMIKVLSLYALLLTFAFHGFKRIVESRTTQAGYGRSQQRRYPNEKKIFLITSVIHTIGFLVTHVIRVMIGVEIVPVSKKHLSRSNRLFLWIKELDGYLDVVSDLFLLPQIVANSFWQNKGKPLRKLYYLGLTSLRVLLHVYDYIRDPVPDRSYGDRQYPYKNLDLYSKFGNIVVAGYYNCSCCDSIQATGK